MKTEILDENGNVLNKTSQKHWLLKSKNWKIMFPWIISIISICIAIYANINTEKANQIANEALATSKYQFLQINRPYITLSAKKFSSEQYRQVSQEGINVHTVFRFQIKNMGNVAAKDVELPDIVALKSNIKFKQFKYYKSDKITLVHCPS